MTFEYTTCTKFQGNWFWYWSLFDLSKSYKKLAVIKQALQKFDGEWYNLRKVNEPEVTKQYQIEIENRIAALENLSDDEDINRAWENIKENVKTLAKGLRLHELKHHRPWCDEEWSWFIDRKKQAKMQCLQDPIQGNIHSKKCS
jgi:hypothetical protein